MTRYRSETVATAFWERAGGRAQFGTPVDIERAATRSLPVAVQRITGLNTGIVKNFLSRVGANPWLDETPRALRGCLVADAGKALVFVDGEDSEEEQRMTIAHEIAHLLLHYLKPREDAESAFGPGILAVLDRTRPAVPGERLSSALRNISIEPFRHAMSRGRSSYAHAVRMMEDEADDLAIELIAPWRQLQGLRGADPGLLRERFGLPAAVATRLSTIIMPVKTSPGVLGLLGARK
ncbi:ImmA/IrrE family metallo-endopeptidase [Burkholderia gladioli]|uniref:ImmA/IrrE family metallo-endopeptidase n=1 Tax=Burkholderia gladioli TaxID=28095 RepID=UPI00163F3B9A|nr:ImmA/IrrE family metallo-endopeptidase [Burkholderia gladioli]